MITATTRVAAVIGSPVAHSLSPVIHNAGFRSLDAPWVYVAFDVPGGSAQAAVRAMNVLGIAGLSVTMPHKSDVASACDRLDAAAAALQSVNTVGRDDDGALVGYSTDGAGWVASAREQGIEIAHRSIAIVGAGGAARSIIDVLAREGAASIAILNRTLSAAQTAAQLAQVAFVGTDDHLHSADIVINTTPLGMVTGAVATGNSTDRPVAGCLPFDPAMIRSGQVVADIVYYPRQTPLLRAAADRGAVCLDGLGMLVHQAAIQQHIWLGQTPNVAAMRDAAEQEIARRGQ